mgnify:CR=1 FL=1
MLAKREHIKNLPILYAEVLKKGRIGEHQINSIAVTQGPGLEPALWTGIVFAKELAEKLKIPLVPANHMEGHIVSTLIEKIDPEFSNLKSINFPALALLISGGHTELVKIDALGSYEILGSTVDDAVGEAFDKVARMLQLPYPGGPEISKLAELARSEHTEKKISLPRPMLHSKNLNFSFSGLKTSVLYMLKEIGTPSQEQLKDIAREFEDAVTEVLISKTQEAIGEYGPQTLILGGGVVANKHIRAAFDQLAGTHNIPLYMPISGLTGDNAVMIALAGALTTTKPSEEGFVAKGNLSL